MKKQKGRGVKPLPSPLDKSNRLKYNEIESEVTMKKVKRRVTITFALVIVGLVGK